MAGKRCFLIVGPESAGNRLAAAVLVRAGCVGQASTEQVWDQTLPENETPAVVIRSFPHGGDWPDLGALLRTLHARGYTATVVVTVREPGALAASQVTRGHVCVQGVNAQIARAYQTICNDLRTADDFVFLPMEALMLHPEGAAASLLRRLGLSVITGATVLIDNDEREITDENGKYYVSSVG